MVLVSCLCWVELVLKWMGLWNEVCIIWLVCCSRGVVSWLFF